jgi:hypothetical protein
VILADHCDELAHAFVSHHDPPNACNTAGMFVGIANGEVFHQIGIMAKVRLMGGLAQVHRKGRIVRPLAVQIDSFSAAASDRQAE